MSGENQFAHQLVADAMEQASNNPHFDQDTLGRAIIAAVLRHYASYRKISDIKQELEFTIDNLDADEFVITRGC